MCSIESASPCLVSIAAPAFEAQAVMPDGAFKELKLSDYKGKKYVLLFFYPLDFTFVCPSEIVAFDKAIKDFESRNVQVLGCSIDSHFTHSAWRNTEVNKGGIGKVKFPLLSDLSHKIAKAYGVHLPAGMALRGLFLIDKEGVLQHSVVNNLPFGRSVDEAIRMIDSIQYHEKNGEVCPANWKKGEKGMKPSAEGLTAYFSNTA